MARTRFLPDTGLTVRMTTVMFLLGGLFVALVVGADVRRASSPGLVVLIGLAGIGVAFFQWWCSDTVGHAGDARPRGHARRRHPSCTA